MIMWKKLSKHFALLVICLLMLIFVIFPYGLSRLFRRLTLNAYLNNEYHLLCDEMKIKYIGNNAHANIRGVHGDRHRWWISAYEIGIPFMSKTFEIWIDKRSNSLYGSNFYEVLSTDFKFQHLYSEWIKKQIGIEDENVEFQFAGNFDNPYIEFDKITSLSEDYREIFENTHNLYCNRCYVSNIDNLNAMTANEIANEIREKYLFGAVKITGIPVNKKISGNIHLSNGIFDKKNDQNYKFRFDLHNFESSLIKEDYY